MKSWTLEDWIDDEREERISTLTIPNVDQSDHTALRHSRGRYDGFSVGSYIQTPPLLFTRDGHNVFLGDMYRGGVAFLILSGPSFVELNTEYLHDAGILTMGVNNSVRSFRPNLWTCVDNPTHFIQSIWMDSKIQKFVPYAHAEKNLFDTIRWKEIDIKVGDCPNVFFYRRNEHFQASQFLFENSINWGNHSDLCMCGYWRNKSRKEKVCPKCGESNFGGRSVMLPAIRLLFYLGIRTIFLLGCDFHMEYGKTNYHFEQDRSKSSVSGNNGTYRLLEKRFKELMPYFSQHNLQIFNCNTQSNLDVFPKVSYRDAIDIAKKFLPDLNEEKTEGLYDRKAKSK
jgi:hypothetical protein